MAALQGGGVSCLQRRPPSASGIWVWHPPDLSYPRPPLCGPPAARHYHANLSPEEREAVQRDWTNGAVPIIVATVAFGMGAWAGLQISLIFAK